MARGRPPKGFGPPPPRRGGGFGGPPRHGGGFGGPPPHRGGRHHHGNNSGAGSVGAGLAVGLVALAAGAIANRAKTEIQNKPVKKKAISKTTSLYLPKIVDDFPDFHSPHAESDIKAVMRDYIFCIHNGRTTLDSDGVNSEVLDRIIPKQNGSVSDIVFNQVEITNYTKTSNYATVMYQISLGYILDNTRQEVLYEIHYSIQTNGLEATGMIKCNNCGAPVKTNGMTTRCAYCDAQIGKDTITSWEVSNIHEIR